MHKKLSSLILISFFFVSTLSASAAAWPQEVIPLDDISIEGQTVRAKAENFEENVIMTSPVAILLRGGFTDGAFSSRTGASVTMLDGSLKIRQGTLSVERLVVR